MEKVVKNGQPVFVVMVGGKPQAVYLDENVMNESVADHRRQGWDDRPVRVPLVISAGPVG